MRRFVRSLPVQMAILAVVFGGVTALVAAFAVAIALFGDPGEEVTLEAAVMLLREKGKKPRRGRRGRRRSSTRAG